MGSADAIDDVMERCIVAGLAVRRADRAAAELRAAAVEHRDLMSTERERLAQLEAEATRLSAAFVAAQGPLHKAGPALFQQRLATVNWIIAERMR